eukprot:1940885-Heterocapsa_arctica.AAC.1
MGGFTAGGSSPQFGGQNQDGAAAGGQKGGVADPGPPPPQAQAAWNLPPQYWNVGQWTPATWVNGSVDTWKQVKIGDVNPWDKRVAQAIKGEWQHFEHGKGYKGN